jgi:hypothetical protein
LIYTVLSFADFSFVLSGMDKECFHDSYPDQTLLIIDISGQQSMNVVMRDPSNKKIFEKMNITSMKESFTTYSGGNYEVCIINTSSNDLNLNFSLKSGVAAKDYSVVPQAKDLKPIEQDLMKLEDYSRDIKHFITYFNTHQKTYKSVQESVVMNISYFSIVIIIIMLVLGLVETLVSRHIILRRKLK